jgi:cytochrome P450
MTFVTAGLSTVLSTHTQLMRHVILNPEVQSKLRAEMLALGDHPTVDQLDVAPYLELVVREALRMTDFVPLERIAQRDTLLPLSQPVTLEDGTVLDAVPIKKGQSIQ